MSAAIVAPSGSTATALPLKGGAVLLSPAAAVGGRRRRMSKKTRKMLRALKKMKGGLETATGEEGVSDADAALGAEPEFEAAAGRRRRRSRRHTRRHRSRRSRAGLFA